MAGFFAHVTMAAHFVVLLYIVLGGFLAWHWPRMAWPHLATTAVAAVINMFGLPCPFTVVENYFRHRQGLGDLPGGFNAHYIYGSLIPRSLLPAVGLLMVAIVVASYVGVYYRRHHQHNGDAPNHQLLG